MTSNHHFYDIKPTIFDIISMVSLTSYPLYWWYHTKCIYEISSAIYDDIISIVYNIMFTIFVTSQPLYLCLTPPLSMISPPLYVWYNTTTCLISYTLYKASHPHFLTTHHIIYDITCTVLLTLLPRYLTLHPRYLCHHNHFIYDLWPTVCMISHLIYVWHLMHYT